MSNIGSQMIRAIRVLLLVAIGVMYIFPFFWMIVTSLKTSFETMQFPPTLWPSHFEWGTYSKVFQSGQFAQFFKNSVFVTTVIVIAQLVTSIMAAYAFAKRDFAGSKWMYAIILSGMMIPMQVTVLPIYLLFSKLGWVNTYWALIVPFLSSSFGIFMLTQAIKQIPNEVLEAAKLDKGSEFSILWNVILPMIKPMIVTLCLFVFIGHWNDLFWTMIMTSSDEYRTLTVGLNRLRELDGMNWNVVMAGNVVLIAPVLIMYLFASNRIRSAFAYGGIK